MVMPAGPAVVKNEHGDCIYVSCISFMELLTLAKENQLAAMSVKWAKFSLPNQWFCEKWGLTSHSANSLPHGLGSSGYVVSTKMDSNWLLTLFDESVTFENKTIWLICRFPFWTAFRKFLLHSYIISGSSSDLPLELHLERFISHLLLSVPLPKPGHPHILVPLPALSEPMILSWPPEKDFPFVDLHYHRLFAYLKIKTVVMIVLSLLAIEHMLIVMSTSPVDCYGWKIFRIWHGCCHVHCAVSSWHSCCPNCWCIKKLSVSILLSSHRHCPLLAVILAVCWFCFFSCHQFL